jgi:hypothetical protein
MTREFLAGAASVVRQFVDPAGAYCPLTRSRSAIAGALTGSLAACLALFLSAGFAVDFEAAATEYEDIRRAELADSGYAASMADSMIAAEVSLARDALAAEPWARLAERVFILVIAGLAVWGVEKATGGRLDPMAAMASAGLAQAAFVMTAAVVTLAESLTGAPDGLLANPLLAAAGYGGGAPRLVELGWLVLGNLNVPSLVSLLLWGLGLSSMLGRPAGWGIRTVGLVYLAGIALTTFPALMAPRGA